MNNAIPLAMYLWSRGLSAIIPMCPSNPYAALKSQRPILKCHESRVKLWVTLIKRDRNILMFTFWVALGSFSGPSSETTSNCTVDEHYPSEKYNKQQSENKANYMSYSMMYCMSHMMRASFKYHEHNNRINCKSDHDSWNTYHKQINLEGCIAPLQNLLLKKDYPFRWPNQAPNYHQQVFSKVSHIFTSLSVLFYVYGNLSSYSGLTYIFIISLFPFYVKLCNWKQERSALYICVSLLLFVFDFRSIYCLTSNCNDLREKDC